MTGSLQNILNAAVRRVLRPLVRILLRNGVAYGAFADMAKRVFVEVASDEFGIPGRKQTVSRVAVITGLTRKEVNRLQSLEVGDDSAIGERYNRAARVVAGWVRDQRFHDAAGDPLPLPFDGGDGPSFSELVRLHSGDMPARAILDELQRVNAVSAEPDGRWRLGARVYIPQTGDADKLHILGTDVGSLIATIDHNMQHASTDPRFQRKVAYDNLPVEAIPEFRKLSADKAQHLLEELDRWLSQHDRDMNPDVEGSGRKAAGIGIYYFEHDVPEDE